MPTNSQDAATVFEGKGYSIFYGPSTTEVRIPTTDSQGRPAVKSLTFAGQPIKESGPEPWQRD